MNERVPIGTYPPGELLQEELAARGWTNAQFAQYLGLELSTVEEILKSRRVITDEIAMAIGEILATGPDVWMNLEKQFQLDKNRMAAHK